MKRARNALLACSLCWLPVAACGQATPPPFSPGWSDDQGRSIAAVRARLAEEALPPGPGVAVGATDEGLAGVLLDGSSTWTHDAPLDARPAITGEVVVASGAGVVFALNARTGKRLWETSSRGRSLRGAGDDGEVTALSLGRPEGGGSLLLTVDRSGAVLLEVDPQPVIGVPAVLGGVVFVPWGNQYVSAVDARTGEELGRLLTRLLVTHATHLGGSLYFGQQKLLRFDDAVARASRGGATLVELPDKPLPGQPPWLPDGTAVVPVEATAHDHVRLLALPAEGSADAPGGSSAGLDSDRYLATYFRVAMGLSAEAGELRWVRSFPNNLLGGAALRGGFALCDTAGRIWLARAEDGGDGGSVELGRSLKSCTVSGGDFAVRRAEPAGPLAKQIIDAIELEDRSLAAFQEFLLEELESVDAPELTRWLIEVVSDARTPSTFAGRARALLTSRRTGAEHMLEALERHYDFLSDVLLPPPVGPLADALAALKDPRAAPLLASHLNDPAGSSDDVARAARALSTLATTEELEELRIFFSLYRATAEDDNMVSAVLSAARALLRLGGAEVVERAADDPLTHHRVREGLAGMISGGGDGRRG